MIKLGTISLLFLTSCGLKITNYVSDNVLYGQWEMNSIVCWDTTRTSELEEYALPDGTSAQIDFGATDFNYSLTSSDCSTSAYGRYSTEFEGDNEDYVTFGSVVSGEACEIDIVDSGAADAGTTSVKFDLYAPNAKDMLWTIEELESGSTVLTLDFFTTFEGSSETSGCGNAGCVCVAEFTKI